MTIALVSQSAAGKSCVQCGAADGTVCARHYCGPRQLALGKGRGRKAHDLATAELCHECNERYMSEGVMPPLCKDKWEASEVRLFLVLLTILRRYNDTSG